MANILRQLNISLIAPFGLKTKGTASARLLPLAQELAGRGHRVRVCVPPYDDPPEISHVQPQIYRNNEVEIVEAAMQPGPVAVQLPRRLVKAALEIAPDVIHVFKPKGYSGLAALLLALRGSPFMLDSDDWEGRGGYNEVAPYSLPQKLLFDWQERDLPRRAKLVTVASRTLQTQIWGLGVKPEQVFYLPNGLSRQKYANWTGAAVEAARQSWRERLGLLDKKVLLAYTRFAEFKPVRLLEIVRGVLDRLPEDERDRVRLLIVGAGYHGEEKALPELAARYGLADKIVQTGQVAWSDISALLRCGDVALYPFDDTLINRARSSVKFLELLVAERPLVTEAVGEIREYLTGSPLSSSLVRPGDNAAFAQTAADLLQTDPAALATLGQQAAAHLWQNYDWAKLVEIAEAAYKEFVI